MTGDDGLKEDEDPLEDVPGVTGALSRFAKPAAVVALLAVVIYAVSVFHGLPLAIIESDSMEPVLSRGDVIYFEAADPAELQVDDIVAVEVPSGYRDKYGYPPTIVHRIVEIGKYAKGTFVVTKGDATSKDPFRAHVSNVKGIYRKLDLPLIGSTWPKLPLVGTVLLFLRSTYGLVYVAALTATAVGYRAVPAWLERRRKEKDFLHRAIGASFETREALEEFSGSISDYARHLKSHTGVMRGLAGTTEELAETTKELKETVRRGRGTVDRREPPVTLNRGRDGRVEASEDGGGTIVLRRTDGGVVPETAEPQGQEESN